MVSVCHNGFQGFNKTLIGYYLSKGFVEGNSLTIFYRVKITQRSHNGANCKAYFFVAATLSLNVKEYGKIMAKYPCAMVGV
jgi:hypothetical protein